MLVVVIYNEFILVKHSTNLVNQYIILYIHIYTPEKFIAHITFKMC